MLIFVKSNPKGLFRPNSFIQKIKKNMELSEIIDKIENLIKTGENKLSGNGENAQETPRSFFTDITYLMLSFFGKILKLPFKIIAKYLKDEIISAIKKDAKLYAFIMMLMGVMFVFFAVLWLSISVAVATYFKEHGNSYLMSIIYSVLFQVVCFILIGIIAFITSRKIKSLEMFKKISKIGK